MSGGPIAYTYKYTVPAWTAAGEYQIPVKAANLHGKSTSVDISFEIVQADMPIKETIVAPNYITPDDINNGINPVIYITSDDSQDAKIEIYNLNGKLVQTLESAQFTPDLKKAVWIIDDNIATGVYLIAIKTGSQKPVFKKVVVIK